MAAFGAWIVVCYFVAPFYYPQYTDTIFVEYIKIFVMFFTATVLVRRLQQARSHAERAIADSRQAASSLAATEERIAATLTELAVQQPEASGRLLALSQTARRQAAHIRDQARHDLPHQRT